MSSKHPNLHLASPLQGEGLQQIFFFKADVAGFGDYNMV